MSHSSNFYKLSEQENKQGTQTSVKGERGKNEKENEKSSFYFHRRGLLQNGEDFDFILFLCC